MIAKRAVLVALTIAYPVVVHVSVMLGRPDIGFVTLMALIMLHTLAQTSAGIHFRFWVIALAISMVLVAVGLRWGPSHALFLPPVAITLYLSISFGKTLLPGQEPLVTRLARLERGKLSLELSAYTRWVTWMWTGFLLIMTLEVALFAAYATVEIWSLFANILNYLFIVALFVAEYVYRISRFGRAKHTSLRQVLSRIAGEGLGTL